MRYVNLKNLPKRVDSLGREVINWGNCCGEKCYFEFDDIKGYIGNLEILFGEINDFHKKINDVYNIILNGNVGITSGYIDVSIKNMPVIKKSEE